ncbi:MAG: OsmC family protein [Ardenticatenaceae bacterium]|nr:OsmC family protein [Ardenticatenaceae bacterium]
MQVTARSLQNLQVEILNGNHLILADETINDGGDDAGPSPYALLLASLAACKVITVHLYARRKKWPVETVTMRLSHEKIYARDCEDCTSEPNAKIDLIESEISFEGNLDDDQKARLAEIADRCPVHRTLTSETKIRTKLVEAIAS